MFIALMNKPRSNTYNLLQGCTTQVPWRARKKNFWNVQGQNLFVLKRHKIFCFKDQLKSFFGPHVVCCTSLNSN